VQSQFVTVMFVLPPTVAVNVCTWPAITTAVDGLTVTVITLPTELLLLHP
jgi:hypothetical protein